MKKTTSVLILLLCALAMVLPGTLKAQSPSPTPVNLEKLTTADELFDYTDQIFPTLQKSIQSLPEDQQRKALAAAILQFDVAIKDFIKRFPQDTRRWSLQLQALDKGRIKPAVGLPAPTEEEVKKGLTEIADSPNAPDDVRSMAAAHLVMLATQKSTDSNLTEQHISRFEAKFPNNPLTRDLRVAQLEKLQSTDPAKATALLKKLSTGSNKEIAGMAAIELSRLETLKKPLDLKFTAVDGSVVELAKLRGKVVLIDFWATWCGPCVEEVPNVVAAYNKLHAQGFEIVGISLDKNKKALETFVKENGMTWPQYFDGKGWNNTIGTKLGIRSIPAMWLLDKKGMIVTTDARQNLEEAVTAELAK
ncbi:MAG: TlpA disulfide reductase family protein [Chthoniobacterales bacterium]